MSSGNPCGLSEISHFGTFQRVGGKAGGFISKKFFHPSSFRNQEKLWKAQTADEKARRKQIELEKRRDEERQVEELRKQMYLAGQGKSSDFLSSRPQESAEDDAGSGQKSEQKQAVDEMRRRKALLRQEQRAKERQAAAAAASEAEVGGAAESTEPGIEGSAPPAPSKATSSSTEALAKSRTKERKARCPLAPEEEAPASLLQKRSNPGKAAGDKQKEAPGWLQKRRRTTGTDNVDTTMTSPPVADG